MSRPVPLAAPDGGKVSTENFKTFYTLLSSIPVNVNYEPLNEIGTGAYGTVFKGLDHTERGGFVAMKKVKMMTSTRGLPTTALREIAVLKTLEDHQHQNIVKLLDVVQNPQGPGENFLNIYLVFEHIDQDLFSYISRCPKPGMPQETIKSIMKQLLSGIDFLHCNRVIHRDIKPHNILVTRDLKIKIADFGLSKIYDFDMTLTTIVVTLYYRAPEVLLNLPYTTAIDMWSCGCIMAELYTLHVLFMGDSEVEQLDKIFRVLGLPSDADWFSNIPISKSTFEPHLPVCLKSVVPEICSFGEDLLKKMLVLDHRERVTALQALKHPYFNEVDV